MAKQLELPLEFQNNCIIIPFEGEKRKLRDPFHQEINRCLNFTDVHQSPIVKPNHSDMPYTVLGFHRRKETVRKDVAIHFFIDDSKFITVLNNPYKYIDELSTYRWVIGPDFSVQPQMPLEDKRHNIFNIKKITAWWQYNGINVIPNVVWCSGIDYEYCFDGLPHNSVIAINSTGIGKDERSKQVWIEGYNKAVEILKPMSIIRYGARQDGEDESISVYFCNENRKAA